MEPWPFDRMNRSRSIQCGSAASNCMKSLNSTVAMSAMPIGAPGCPLLACCTASMDKKRMQLAISRRCLSRGAGTVFGVQRDPQQHQA